MHRLVKYNYFNFLFDQVQMLLNIVYIVINWVGSNHHNSVIH